MIDVEEIVKALEDHEVGCKPYDESKGMTVNALCAECINQIRKGKGNRHIQISMDDEGNAFHTLFYSFTDRGKGDYDYHDKVNLRNIILLG